MYIGTNNIKHISKYKGEDNLKNCVYRIVNKINNKVYIGSTIDSERRKLEHFNQLEKGIHINTHLQNAYNKYGKNVFIFDIIEDNLDNGELMKREQHYINLFNSSNGNFGYNISQYANQPDGRKYTKTYIVKLRDMISKLNLNATSISLLFCMQLYLEPYTNRILNPDKKNITNKDLQEISNLAKNIVLRALNELEYNHFIRRMGNRQARIIYLNPYIITAGYKVQQETYDMFKGE